MARSELCGGASFFRWLAAEVRKRREAILSTRKKELERFGNIHLELGDPSKTWSAVHTSKRLRPHVTGGSDTTFQKSCA